MVQTRSQRTAAANDGTTTKQRKAPAKATAPDADDEPKDRTSLYGALLRRFPLAMNAVQAGALSAASQLLSQRLKGAAALDFAPALQFALISAFVVTPVSTVFFTIVGKFRLRTPASLALDFFVGGPFLNCAFIAALHGLQGQDLAFIFGVLRSRAFWVDMVLGSNKVWLPAKVAMYSLVPPEYWGLWCSCVSFGWGIVLATIVSDAN